MRTSKKTQKNKNYQFLGPWKSLVWVYTSQALFLGQGIQEFCHLFELLGFWAYWNQILEKLISLGNAILTFQLVDRRLANKQLLKFWAKLQVMTKTKGKTKKSWRVPVVPGRCPQYSDLSQLLILHLALARVYMI